MSNRGLHEDALLSGVSGRGVRVPVRTCSRETAVLGEAYTRRANGGQGGGAARSSSSGAPELGIPGVAERIAKEVEAEDGQADREAREHGEPRRLLHEGAARAAQHEPPGRGGRLGPEA